MTATELTCECGAKFVTRYQSKYAILCYECRRKKRLEQSREWKRKLTVKTSGMGIESKIVRLQAAKFYHCEQIGVRIEVTVI